MDEMKKKKLVVSTLPTEQVVKIPDRGTDFSLRQFVHTASRASPASYARGTTGHFYPEENRLKREADDSTAFNTGHKDTYNFSSLSLFIFRVLYLRLLQL
jgi:hypothetical protein